MGRVPDQVEQLERLCHRYLEQPEDELIRIALIKGLEVVRRLAVDHGEPAVVRGLMAQCQTYAEFLQDDLQRGDCTTASVERLCRKLGELGEEVKTAEA